MINYGEAPAHDELEITVFGPGYGEAIVIHLGENNWILIDSCIEPDSKSPAALHYLSEINVPTDSVQAIIASHWHDDHVKGLSKVVSKCVNAEFFMSSVFNDKELMAFLLAHSPISGAPQAGGTKELSQIIEIKKPFWATQRTIILDKKILGRQIQVTAFSPTQDAQANMLLHLADYIPKNTDPINHAPDSKPNLSAIVVHIDYGDDAVLLGSDLEEHGDIGWKGVLEHEWCLTKQKASAYKVAHHGSVTAHNQGIWSELLKDKPISMMTPFVRGSVSLPTDADKARVKQNSSEAYLSSTASKKPEMDSAIEKRLLSISTNLSKVNAGFGGVRLRRKLNENWRVETLGRAQLL